VQTFPITFRAADEPQPGAGFAARFEDLWPAYRRWFLLEGDRARPSYVTGRRMLQTFMPELIGIYDRLVELAGGGDLAARMLSLYRPSPYLAGCSQAARSTGEPLLVRNYDYAPERLEAVVVRTCWNGRGVIGMSDCLWGLLDGINEDGLAVSLTFGGRRVLGDGFGIPLVVRYLLETCADVAEARRTLERLPFQMAHNLTLADVSGAAVTAEVAPDRDVVFREPAVATNHQGAVDWHEHAQMTRTIERERYLLSLMADPGLGPDEFIGAFAAPPLYTTSLSRGFGTLYTAVYRPLTGQVELRWPGATWRQSFADFREEAVKAVLTEPVAA
jgi:predicted choloylglycine hydrolase